MFSQVMESHQRTRRQRSKILSYLAQTLRLPALL